MSVRINKQYPSRAVQAFVQDRTIDPRFRSQVLGYMQQHVFTPVTGSAGNGYVRLQLSPYEQYPASFALDTETIRYIWQAGGIGLNEKREVITFLLAYKLVELVKGNLGAVHENDFTQGLKALKRELPIVDAFMINSENQDFDFKGKLFDYVCFVLKDSMEKYLNDLLYLKHLLGEKLSESYLELKKLLTIISEVPDFVRDNDSPFAHNGRNGTNEPNPQLLGELNTVSKNLFAGGLDARILGVAYSLAS